MITISFDELSQYAYSENMTEEYMEAKIYAKVFNSIIYDMRDVGIFSKD